MDISNATFVSSKDTRKQSVLVAPAIVHMQFPPPYKFLGRETVFILYYLWMSVPFRYRNVERHHAFHFGGSLVEFNLWGTRPIF